MLEYIIRRILFIIPTIFAISIISFFLINAPPGDVISMQLEQLSEQYGSSEAIEALRYKYGLDKPLYVRYFMWMSNILLRWDFGRSYVYNRPVKEILSERLPYTILLALVTLLFQWIVSIPIAIISAIKQHSWFDYIFTFLSFLGQSTPNFLFALVLMTFFYYQFGWSMGGLFSPEYQSEPWTYYKALNLFQHMIVPIIVIGTAGTAFLVRVMRGTMLDEIKKHYVRAARAKGLSETALMLRHPTKVAILPLISIIGWLLPTIVSGETIVSIVMNLPTTGVVLYQSLLNQDMFLAGSIILLITTLTVVGMLISDILLGFLDPTIRYG